MSIAIKPSDELQILSNKLFTKVKMYLEFSELSSDQVELYSIFKDYMQDNNKTFMDMADMVSFSPREVEAFLKLPIGDLTEYFLLQALHKIIHDPKVEPKLNDILDKKKAISIKNNIIFAQSKIKW